MLDQAPAVSLVPEREGPEVTEFSPDAVVAFAGTGFDPESMQHRRGDDVVRFAIAIQQYRDAGEYEKADAARDRVSGTYEVKQGAGWTSLSFRGDPPFATAPFEILQGIVYAPRPRNR